MHGLECCSPVWASMPLACGVPASLLVKMQLSVPQMPKSVSCGKRGIAVRTQQGYTQC